MKINEKAMETIDKILTKGGKIQLEYNHQKGVIKVLDCSPTKVLEINVNDDLGVDKQEFQVYTIGEVKSDTNGRYRKCM